MSARGLLPERVFQGVILAINPDGTLKWESHHGFNPTALSIGGDGTIYFTDTSTVHGIEDWKADFVELTQSFFEVA